MKKVMMGSVLAGAMILAGCGDTTTTVIKQQAPAEATEVATAKDTDEWPDDLQMQFLDGCGGDSYCQCILDELMKRLPGEEAVASSNPAVEYDAETRDAARACT